MKMLMKVMAFVFLTSVPSCSSICAQTSLEEPKFSVVITQKPSVGSDIVIGVKIKNISKATIITLYGIPGDLPLDYEYDVRDERGIALAAQPDARRIYETTKPEKIEMNPGQSMDTNVEISDYFPFHHPGRYTIQISREGPGMPKVYSNILAVSLIDAHEKPEFIVTLKAVTPEVKLGSNVVVDISVTNISGKPVYIPILGWHGTLIDSLRYDVRDDKGAEVASYVQRFVKLRNGKTLAIPTHLPGSVNNGGEIIPPGKSDEIEHEGRLNEVYSFDHLGRYTIQASLKASGVPMVHSNIISVNVVAPLRKHHGRK